MEILKRITETTKKKGPAGLERMRRLLELLGNPEKDLRIIHVAGTNGKGSASYYIKSLLEAAGFRVGMFTSPHVMDFNERYQLGEEMIADEDFEHYADYVLGFNERLKQEGYGYPSQFEILTCVAYLYFRDIQPDYTIMEVGIGGRLDSTNTITRPEICVITQVGIDHVEMLGDTISDIAGEKAGIIKQGVTVVSQSPEPEIRAVISNRAELMNAELIDASQFEYEITEPALETLGGYVTRFNLTMGDRRYDDLVLSMIGEHQVRNAITSLAAVSRLVDISEEAVRMGLMLARNPGRFEFIASGPNVIIDGAHNPCGTEAAIETFNTAFPEANFDRIMVVFGCLSDKECVTMIGKVAAGFAGAHFFAAAPDSERAMSPEEVRAHFVSCGCECGIVSSCEELLDNRLSEEYDTILILGSIYLIGEVRKLFTERE